MNQTPQELIPAAGRKAGPLGRLRKVLEHKADAIEVHHIETGFETPKRYGLFIVFMVFGVFGLWSLVAPLEGYAPAPGFLAVKSHKKTIQHLEGGIVKEILVQDGDLVNTNAVLMVLDSTQSLAQLEIFTGQMTALIAMEARLLAERDNLDTIAWPQELPAEGLALDERRSQEQIFAARKTSRDGETALLVQRIGQFESRVTGLEAVQDSKNQLATSFAEELADVRILLADGFENKQRLRDLERNHAQAAGEAAELAATIATTEIQISETQQQILQLQNELQREVAGQLGQTQNELQNARERVTALRDIVARTEVRATEAGVVNRLQIHTIGGVIPPGAVIAEIVPQSDEFVIESTLQISDIDRVVEGQEVMIRLSAFSTKTVPRLSGTVLSISADSMADQATGARFYTVRIGLDPESLAALEGMELVPGMPAEAFIATGSRTFLQYLMKPLSNSVARSFNED